jgi:hypothetical protein
LSIVSNSQDFPVRHSEVDGPLTVEMIEMLGNGLANDFQKRK